MSIVAGGLYAVRSRRQRVPAGDGQAGGEPVSVGAVRAIAD